MGGGLSKGKAGGRKVAPAAGAFAVEEEVKRKLIPLDYSDEEEAAVAKPPPKAAVALSKEQLTALIASIPTGKDALYLEAVEWEIVEVRLG